MLKQLQSSFAAIFSCAGTMTRGAHAIFGLSLFVLGLSPINTVLAVKHRCDWCKAQPVDCYRCQGCGMVRYCSRFCQKKHWKEGHKMMCKRWEALSRAIDTPVDDTLPDDDESFCRWYDQYIVNREAEPNQDAEATPGAASSGAEPSSSGAHTIDRLTQPSLSGAEPSWSDPPLLNHV